MDMLTVRRFLAVGALLALATATSPPLVGDQGSPKDPSKAPGTPGSVSQDAAALAKFPEAKFLGEGVHTYQTAGGDTLFAMKVAPKLTPRGTRPTDYLVLV